MTASEIKSIEESARRFRRALEICPKKNLPITFENFPRGSCGDAALLLAKHLQQEGFGDFDYILGETGTRAAGTWHSHAWLRRGELIIDITADQFPDVDAAVIVEIDTQWHKKYRIEDVHPADYEVYDDRTRSLLAAAYRRVVVFLEPPGTGAAE